MFVSIKLKASSSIVSYGTISSKRFSFYRIGFYLCLFKSFSTQIYHSWSLTLSLICFANPKMILLYDPNFFLYDSCCLTQRLGVFTVFMYSFIRWATSFLMFLQSILFRFIIRNSTYLWSYFSFHFAYFFDPKYFFFVWATFSILLNIVLSNLICQKCTFLIL